MTTWVWTIPWFGHVLDVAQAEAAEQMAKQRQEMERQAKEYDEQQAAYDARMGDVVDGECEDVTDQKKIEGPHTK